jgi:hypothetical protein
MAGELIIPEKHIDTTLLCYLNPNRFSDPKSRSAVEILHRICYANLTDSENPKCLHIRDLILTEEERKIVLDNKWNISANLEVKARCNDVLCRFEKDKRHIKILASDTYLDAFKEFGKKDFLIRSVTVRDFKKINTKKFLQDILNVVFEKEISSFWLKNLIGDLLRSYSIEELYEIIAYIDSKRKDANEEKQFIDERNYIEALKLLHHFDDIVYHKLMALSFESEADETANNKEENTFYPNLVNDYQNAYNEAFEIKKQEPELYTRLKEKLLKERSNFMEMLSLGGLKYKIEIPENFIKNVEDSISQISINNFFGTINLMRSIPHVTHEEIDAYVRISQKASTVLSWFGSSLLDDNGFEVGSANPDEAIRTEAHVYCRQKRLYLIQNYLYLHKWSKINTEEDFLYYFLRDNKPEFVDEDNIIFWVKGIYAGLNGDFVTASFVLTPQIEHALLNIAEIEEGNITSLERKRQLSPTLGAILPRLRNVFDEEEHFEINSFLQGEVDVNFRNNLLHGLFKSFEIEKYGPYLWWLSLKIYFDNNNY